MDYTVLLVILFDFSWKNQPLCSSNMTMKTTEDTNDLKKKQPQSDHVSCVFCLKTTDIIDLMGGD